MFLFALLFDVRVGFSGFGLAPFFPWVGIGELDCLESVSVICIDKNILLEVDEGVMVALKLVISTKDVLEVENKGL